MRIRCVSSPYQITQKYGYDSSYPLNGGNHTGTDYISDGRILAPMDSIVAGTGYDSVNGNFLILEAPGYRDWFSHIKTDGYLVSTGQTVKRGQHIAWQGRTGSATGVHVHHSLRKNGVMVDPELNITEEEMIQDTNDEFARWAQLHHQLLGYAGTREVFRQLAVGQTWLKQIEILSDHHDAYARQTAVQQLEARVTEISRALAIVQKENATLKAQVGDTTALNMIKEGFKLLLGLK